ncbi:MAG: DUF3160 domain-containing protein [Deltaproteobacteria bacterium]|uniref:DUF3160 domain-containing protein n=1 Tax=Candidatus Zymogenus saltonus TaxID=2844893 RepID=A0A9D8PN99_9DELT|nr:DUF3160 domain-containing protein [Candidatus Zymogenus saltonus]
MKKAVSFLTVVFFSIMLLPQIGCALEKETESSLNREIEAMNLSEKAKKIFGKNGFVIVPGFEDEITDIYKQADEDDEPVFVTTDAVLHTAHIFYDYLLRILEMDKLYATLLRLIDRMLAISVEQYNDAQDESVKEAARLNIGYFAVAKKIFDPAYEVGYGLDELVNKEIENIKAHKDIKYRELLTYVENPGLYTTPYAFEDYSQYVPRGHYTRNEKFETYFKAMMWHGRIDFKLKPGESEEAQKHGLMMTLQALLISDALMRDEEAFTLWKQIYEPTTYFVGKTDDLDVYDYRKLMKKIFPKGGGVDKYGDIDNVLKFIDEAMKLHPPKILSGAAFVEDGKFENTTMGFRFMGQRFIPDSYIFQNLVYGAKKFKYTGSGKPFTMEEIPNFGPSRAFPRGLDIFAVLGSDRAHEILKLEGDTDYTYYEEQINLLKKEFSSKTTEDWGQNLYWRWLYALIPLLDAKSGDSVPAFMSTVAWMDKELQTALGSWAELRHDTILYAKQSYTMVGRGMPIEVKFPYGYVEPYPEVYGRIEEMMADLGANLDALGIAPEGVPEKIRKFEELLAQLKTISEKELRDEELSQEEYNTIRKVGTKLGSMTYFSGEIARMITSDTDTKMDIIADVHTDLNTSYVLEVGVGSPFNIFVIVEDAKGKRICRGGVFSFYEFKHPMSDRLTDEKWQKMKEDKKRPSQPPWIKAITAE